MQVRVLGFGVLKDWLGAPEATVELPEGATVRELLARLSATQPVPRGIAVSVNAEFVAATHALSEGDEVGLLPPVSGGCAQAQVPGGASEVQAVVTALTREPIDAAKLIAAAQRGEDGAVVVFDGIVRNHTRGRKTLYLDYEAYEAMAAQQMEGLARRDHGSPAGKAGGGRDQRADRGGFGASRPRFRGLPLADRHAQKNGADLEERDLCGRSCVGGGRSLSRRAGRGRRGGIE